MTPRQVLASFSGLSPGKESGSPPTFLQETVHPADLKVKNAPYPSHTWSTWLMSQGQGRWGHPRCSRGPGGAGVAAWGTLWAQEGAGASGF